MSIKIKLRKVMVYTPPVGSFRPDIQGLRALAVVVVILNHLTGWPSGGFVGVDIFFVISGFLITGLMLREHARTGQISWIGFYKRRVRRIMPAAVVCLVVVVVAAFLIYRTARFDSIRSDAIWSLLFTSNWHFAAAGTDYFQSDGPLSPLQHFWSLAVEEQFYIVWPILLITVLGTIGRHLRVRGKSANKLLVTIMVGVCAISFAWALLQTGSSPTRAYFSTFTRCWELAVGALLAVLATRLARLPDGWRPVLAWAGLAAIIASLLVVTPTSAFPGPWAALPVAGAAMVLAAGIGGQPRYSWALTNSASVYIGKISYLLYLWHFPVIVLLAAVVESGSRDYYLLTVVATAILSIASFHLVEDSVRKSTWLNPECGDLGRQHGGARRTKVASGIAYSGLVMLSVLVLVAAAFAIRVQDADVSSTTATSPTPSLAATTTPLDPQTTAQADLSTKIAAALDATSWPDLTPSIDDLGRDALAPEWSSDGCLAADRASNDDPQANAEHCVYGDPAAAKTAVLLGDSVAISYLPGLRAALEPAGFNIRVLTMAQCPVEKLEVVRTDGSAHTECDPFREWSFKQVAESDPNLVIFSTSGGTLDRISAEPTDAGKMLRMRAGLQASLSDLQSSGGRLIVLEAPPGTPSLEKCATKLSSPSQCEGVVDARDTDLDGIYREELSSRADPEISYIRTESWFCSASGNRPAFSGTTPIFGDGVHLTAAYSEQLAPVLRAALLGPPGGAEPPVTTPPAG